MTAFEQLTVGYFAALALASSWSVATRRRRVQAVAVAAAVATVVWLLARRDAWTLRVWLPHAYLLAAYWLPATLAPVPSGATRLERTLRAIDLKIAARVPAIPGWRSRALEAAYLLCYPIVPAAFAVVWWQGTRDDVDRFWMSVLASGYSCYAVLPWVVSRPPRAVDPAPPSRSSVRALNVFVLDRFSHGLNTFPSGHVAVSFAAAGAVTGIDPAGGAALWVIAVGIAAGAVAGRYHYAADVVAGAGVGLLVLALT